MATTSGNLPTVFISHSSEDEEWRDRIIHHLAPLEVAGSIRIYSNSCTDSEGGSYVAGTPEAAMADTAVALLLLSVDSIGSLSFMSFDAEFFVNKANYGEILLIPVLLFDCDWRKTSLFDPLKVFRHNDLPLAALDPNEIEAALDSLVKVIVAGITPMPPFYFKTEFKLPTTVKNWPTEFVIVTAYATTGEHWTPKKNQDAAESLEYFLRGRGGWLVRLTGFNPTTGHAEPGWAFEMSFEEACDLGRKYRQDAIYHGQGDQLSVTYCDQRRAMVPVGRFRDRLHLPTCDCSHCLSPAPV